MLGDREMTHKELKEVCRLSQLDIKEYKEKCEELEKENLLTQYRLLEIFIDSQPKTYRKRMANVWIVQEFLQRNTSKAGSTRSYEKCRMLEIDPDSYEIKCYFDYKKQLEKNQ